MFPYSAGPKILWTEFKFRTSKLYPRALSAYRLPLSEASPAWSFPQVHIPFDEVVVKLSTIAVGSTTIADLSSSLRLTRMQALSTNRSATSFCSTITPLYSISFAINQSRILPNLCWLQFGSRPYYSPCSFSGSAPLSSLL